MDPIWIEMCQIMQISKSIQNTFLKTHYVLILLKTL